MVTKSERLTDFPDSELPQPGFEAELLCEDHNGTYVLPFPCKRTESGWLNAKTGEILQAKVVGWRAWLPKRAAQKNIE